MLCTPDPLLLTTDLFNRLHDLLIATAAAEISGQIIANLLFRGFWIFVEQCFRRENETRCAIAALKSTELHKRFLKRMQRFCSAQSFDGHDFTTVNVRRQYRARAHGFTGDEQRASAANLDVAAELGARETKLIANHIEESHSRLDFEILLDAVHFK